MPVIKDKEYRRGLMDETRVIESMREAGHDVRESSHIENCEQDIDCWVGETPISIKSQAAARKTGRIVLELEVKKVIDRYASPVSCDPDDYEYRWEKSWFWNGKADKYLILVGERLLVVPTDKLKCLVKGRLAGDGNPNVYITEGNKPETVRRQMQAGHAHHDARLALVNVQSLVSSGIATWVAMPPNPQGKPAQVKVLNKNYKLYQPEGLV